MSCTFKLAQLQGLQACFRCNLLVILVLVSSKTIQLVLYKSSLLLLYILSWEKCWVSEWLIHIFFKLGLPRFQIRCCYFSNILTWERRIQQVFTSVCSAAVFILNESMIQRVTFRITCFIRSQRFEEEKIWLLHIFRKYLFTKHWTAVKPK